MKLYIIGVISAFFSLVIVGALCWGIGGIIEPIDYSKQISLLFADGVTSFRPEPIEKLQYVTALISFPLILLFLMHSFNKLAEKKLFADKLLGSKQVYYFIVFSSLVIILFILMIDLKKVNFFYLKGYYPYEQPIKTLYILLISIVLLMLKKRYNYIIRVGKKTPPIANILLEILMWFFMIVSSAINVTSIYMVNESGRFLSHFNAVYYSVSAVVAGKTLLVNEINQYGLYPHLIEPVFLLFHLDILSFTWLMSLLILATFVCWYLMLKIIVNKLFATIGLSTVIFFGYIQFKLLFEDSYFQYYPIRTIFPALFLYLSVLFFKERNIKLYWTLNIMCPIALLWNPETGAIVLVTWIMVYIFDQLSDGKKIRTFLNHLANVSVTSISVVVIYCFFIWLRSGSLPNFMEFLTYIRYFYTYGMMMLPMPLIHPWNIITVIYILGLLISIATLLKKQNSIENTMIFLLSILGCGLFSYYQGRSHDYVLSAVWYPAFILLAIFAHRLWKTIPCFRYIERTIAFIMLCLMVASVASLFYNSNKLLQRIKINFTTQSETSITNAAEFIKNHSETGSKQLILSFNSGIYYSYSKTIPGLDVPGSSEMLLQRDFDGLAESIRGKTFRQIYLDKNYLSLSYSSNIKIVRELLKNYSLIDMNDSGNMFRMVPKEGLPLDPEVQSYLVSGGNEVVVHYSSFGIEDWLFDLKEKQVVGFVKSKLPKINLKEQFTIETLVKPSIQDSPYAVIMGNHPGYNGYEGFVIQRNGESQNEYSFGYGNGSEFSEPINFSLNNEKWNYLVITYDRGLIKVYLNNVLTYSKQAMIEYKNSEMEFIIGDWINSNRRFIGEIKEVKIHNSILTADNIHSNWKLVEEQLLSK